MDLFWSGLIVRASEHKWNQRKSQFNKVFETAIQDTEMEKREEAVSYLSLKENIEIKR